MLDWRKGFALYQRYPVINVLHAGSVIELMISKQVIQSAIMQVQILRSRVGGAS